MKEKSRSQWKALRLVFGMKEISGASLPVDISDVLPYHNARLKTADYDHRVGILIWKEKGRSYAFRPREIAEGMQLETHLQASRFPKAEQVAVGNEHVIVHTVESQSVALYNAVGLHRYTVCGIFRDQRAYVGDFWHRAGYAAPFKHTVDIRRKRAVHAGAEHEGELIFELIEA